jgi:hypothetical protein
MSQDSEDPLWHILTTAVHPAPSSGRKIFFVVIVTVLVFAGLFLSIVSSPFISDWWGCVVSADVFGPVGSERIKHWCDWIAMISQILIFIAIGGIFFTDEAAKKLKASLDRLQHRLVSSATANAEQDQRDFRNAVRKIKHISDSHLPFLHRIRELSAATATITYDGLHLPRTYLWFLARGVLFNVPGQLYGFLAFIFVLLQLLAISTKIVFDYLPSDACH